MDKNSQEIIVKFDEVTKQYGDLVVLDKLNLNIKKNEMVSIIGPSGSGKTTVLRVLMTLEKINGGVIHLDGEPLTHMDTNGKLIEANEKYLRDRRSKIGMVFQQFNLFPHMTALQNCIEAPVEVLGMKKEEAEKRALELLELVGLTDKKDQHPSRLSGGQQQRIALARCFVYEPSIILMDEPLGALDKKLRDSLQREIKHLHDNLGITVIYVTHDQEEAMVMSDRVCLMNEGRIEQIGSPSELYFQPKSIFAADFLGESNLFAGKVVRQAAEGMTIERADGVAVSGICDDQVSDGETVHYMIRPENIRVSLDKGSEENFARGKLKETIMIGQLTKYFLELADESELVATTLTGSHRGSLQDGDEVFFGWSTSDARIMLGS